MNEKIILTTWSDPDSHNSAAPTRYWYRVMLTANGGNNVQDGQHVAVYIQKTREKHGFTMGLQDSDWQTIRQVDYAGGYLVATLLEWGIPMPAFTDRPDAV